MVESSTSLDRNPTLTGSSYTAAGKHISPTRLSDVRFRAFIQARLGIIARHGVCTDGAQCLGKFDLRVSSPGVRHRVAGGRGNGIHSVAGALNLRTSYGATRVYNFVDEPSVGGEGDR